MYWALLLSLPSSVQGDVNTLRAQLACATPADVDVLDERGYAAIHWAVLVNSLECVELLAEMDVEHLAQLTAQNQSCLHLAAREGDAVVSWNLVTSLVKPCHDTTSVADAGTSPVRGSIPSAPGAT